MTAKKFVDMTPEDLATWMCERRVTHLEFSEHGAIVEMSPMAFAEAREAAELLKSRKDPPPQEVREPVAGDDAAAEEEWARTIAAGGNR